MISLKDSYKGARKLTEEEVDYLIDKADLDRDGNLNYQEFVKMLSTNEDFY